ncbi:MAG TPA: hypothetical protein VGL96_06445, partial [Casimicrobiaceae bacterium]
TRLLDTVVPAQSPTLVANGSTLVAHCGGGGTLEVVELEIDAILVSPAGFVERFGDAPVPLG